MAKLSRKHVVDRASGHQISAGPEEINATQPLLEILIDKCGWNPLQIVSRPNQWRVPESPSGDRKWPVDIAIFESASKVRDEDNIRIICECKNSTETVGLRQLKTYLGCEPHARVGIWFNGIDHAIVYKSVNDFIVAPPGTPIPRPGDPLHPGGKRSLLTYANLREAPSLKPLFQRIRNKLAATDPNVIRDEFILPDLSSLLLLKIRDEQTHRYNKTEPLSFQAYQTREETANAIRELLRDETQLHPDLFGDSPPYMSISTESIAYVVEELQGLKLLPDSDNRRDAISDAFQVLRGKAYKGEEGQFFTPPSVVEIATVAVSPKVNDRVVDPACGSGSFLAGCLNHVVAQIEVEHKGDPLAIQGETKRWAEYNLFAMDKDSVSVRLSKAFLSLLGDGSAHVFKGDSLQKSLWVDRKDGLTSRIIDGTFNVVITNPPFGRKLKFPKNRGRAEGYEVSKRWVFDKEGGTYEAGDVYEDRDIGVVFLERCLALLDDQRGRLAIVLPDTYLFSSSFQWLVRWICNTCTITHSINVPIEVFEPHCRAKTSILVLRKGKPGKDHEVIGSVPESYGENKKGKQVFRLDSAGDRTETPEDEMSEAAKLLTEPMAGESRLKFRFKQSEARRSGVLVASYFWRRPYLDALTAFADANDCELKTFEDLRRDKVIDIHPGHGSPRAQFKGRGVVPYVKVSDIKNWKINENPKNAIPAGEAARLLRNKVILQDFDLVTPTRTTKNIGLVGVVMPWQRAMVLTREIAVIRSNRPDVISNWLLLVMMSLRVVNDQFKYLVLMQMNREDLGRRILELQVPVPRTAEGRERWASPVREYFEAQVRARTSYELLNRELRPDLFVDRP